jgi:hypothetical protein
MMIWQQPGRHRTLYPMSSSVLNPTASVSCGNQTDPHRRNYMNHGLSDQVRSLALEKFVQPAKRAGKTHFSVAVRDLMQELRTQGFPADNWPQVCTAIQTDKFLRANGLEIEAVDGPPSKKSTTVIVRYRVASPKMGSNTEVIPTTDASSDSHNEANQESPEEWAHRLTGKLFGLLKEELAEYGGGEAFLRWVRSEDEDAA